MRTRGKAAAPRRRRAPADGRVGAVSRGLVVLIVVGCALLVAAPAALAATVTATLTPATLIYGQTTVVAGTVDPAVEGQQVSIALDGVEIATATTDVGGQFSVTVTPQRGGDVTATLVVDASVSAPVTLTVKPKITTTHGTLVPFAKTTFTVKVAPASYNGLVTMRVYHHGIKIGGAVVRARSGKAVFAPNLVGVGAFSVQIELAPVGGLAGRTVRVDLKTVGHRLVVGSSGPWVRAMLSRLAYLKFRIPGLSSTLTTNGSDAVVAFQKAYGLPRTYVFDDDDWKKLDTAKVIKPRLTSPSLHIEVDKGRQILYIVKNGKIFGIIAVSTGATGNTPEGRFHIHSKHPSTTTFAGTGLLYRTMGFIGNFAIHGYYPVPPYPASHGCVREPMWVADWTYNNSFIGELVYIYH
jgi:N-acetylmuramoyl-L-alanine amidase